MTRDDYERLLDLWTQEVKAEALRLFEDGALIQECTGMAINIVESRRKRTAAEQQRFAPTGVRRN